MVIVPFWWCNWNQWCGDISTTIGWANHKRIRLSAYSKIFFAETKLQPNRFYVSIYPSLFLSSFIPSTLTHVFFYKFKDTVSSLTCELFHGLEIKQILFEKNNSFLKQRKMRLWILKEKIRLVHFQKLRKYNVNNLIIKCLKWHFGKKRNERTLKYVKLKALLRINFLAFILKENNVSTPEL